MLYIFLFQLGLGWVELAHWIEGGHNISPQTRESWHSFRISTGCGWDVFNEWGPCNGRYTAWWEQSGLQHRMWHFPCPTPSPSFCSAVQCVEFHHQCCKVRLVARIPCSSFCFILNVIRWFEILSLFLSWRECSSEELAFSFKGLEGSGLWVRWTWFKPGSAA